MPTKGYRTMAERAEMSPGVRNAMRHFEAGLRIRRLEAALLKIRDGLADTGSTPGKRMTLITKADAFEIARVALLD